jgi:hypothetical protein
MSVRQQFAVISAIIIFFIVCALFQTGSWEVRAGSVRVNTPVVHPTVVNTSKPPPSGSAVTSRVGNVKVNVGKVSGPSWAKDDQSPKETVTFEYGGIPTTTSKFNMKHFEPK